jgi:ATP-dependent DNA helicase RecQ
VLKLTAKAQPLLRGDEALVLAKPRTRVPTKKQRKAADRSSRAAALAGLDVDEELFERLRTLRKRLADAQRVPAYVVFSDATLAEMAARKPRTLADLLEVGGVGQTKLERYGEAFIDVIADAEEGEAPGPPGALV